MPCVMVSVRMYINLCIHMYQVSNICMCVYITHRSLNFSSTLWLYLPNDARALVSFQSAIAWNRIISLPQALPPSSELHFSPRYIISVCMSQHTLPKVALWKWMNTYYEIDNLQSSSRTLLEIASIRSDGYKNKNRTIIFIFVLINILWFFF